MAKKINNQSQIRTTENDAILAHMAQNPKIKTQMEAQEMKRLGGNYTATPLVTRLADEHNEQERITQEVVKKPAQVKYFREKAKSESPTTRATRLVKRQSANDRLKAKYGKNYNPEAIRAKQRKLIAAGYDLGKSGADGDWGAKSKAAWEQYQAKNNKTSTTKIPNNQTQPTSNEIKSISQEKAQQLYQNGTGKVDTYLTGLFHMIMPESVAIPHSNGLKDQVAAEIAYTEGLDKSKREVDPHNIKGGTYIGYGIHGTMSGQSQNINQQGNSNNGAAKVMGGYRYFKNDDGSVDVIDPYAFNVVRDFSRTNSKGDPYVYKQGEEDPYAGREWAGLWHDITSEGAGKTVQNVMENFFTRQGKNRSNNIHFEPGEINRRTNQL